MAAENDLAGAMVAQTYRALLAIAQGNAPKEPTVKILEYKDMEPFFVRARATSLEQQQLAERHKKSVKVEMMRRNSRSVLPSDFTGMAIQHGNFGRRFTNRRRPMAATWPRVGSRTFSLT
jgi:hypothetical protein